METACADAAASDESVYSADITKLLPLIVADLKVRSSPKTSASSPPPVEIETPPVPGPRISMRSSPEPARTISVFSIVISLLPEPSSTNVSEPVPPSNASPETARPLNVRTSSPNAPFRISCTTASRVTVLAPPDRVTSLVGSVPVTSIMAVASLFPPCGSTTVYLKVSIRV